MTAIVSDIMKTAGLVRIFIMVLEIRPDNHNEPKLITALFLIGKNNYRNTTCHVH